MIRAGILALGLAGGFGLAGCGFTPAYAPLSMADAKQTGPIHVDEIEGRTGHFLRQELVRTIGQGVPGFKQSSTLEIKLTENILRLGFAPDQAASRSDYIGKVVWTLRGANGTPLASGNTEQAASFNFADAPYADIAAQTAAKERVATMLARAIRDQLIFAAGKDPSKAVKAPPPPERPPLPGQGKSLLPSTVVQ